MPNIKSKRPVFYHNDDKELEVKAGGVIIYKIHKKTKKMSMLLIKNRGKYEDIGGCTDQKDKSIQDTIAREVDEETNSIIKSKNIKKRFEDGVEVFNKWSKYLIYVLEATDDERKLKSDDFGDREIHDDIERTVHWIKYDSFIKNDFIKDKLNFRLKNKIIFEQLKKIDDQNNGNNEDSESSDEENLFLDNDDD
jgi:ADP-ribose pyrophosphatase YjhB (NUDIX family)